MSPTPSVDLRFYDPANEQAYLNQLGENIRQARRKKSASQEALAQVAGISVTFLGSIERGCENPSMRTLLRISFALECAPESLLPICAAPCKAAQEPRTNPQSVHPQT